MHCVCKDAGVSKSDLHCSLCLSLVSCSQFFRELYNLPKTRSGPKELRYTRNSNGEIAGDLAIFHGSVYSREPKPDWTISIVQGTAPESGADSNELERDVEFLLSKSSEANAGSVDQDTEYVLCLQRSISIDAASAPGNDTALKDPGYVLSLRVERPRPATTRSGPVNVPRKPKYRYALFVPYIDPTTRSEEYVLYTLPVQTKSIESDPEYARRQALSRGTWQDSCNQSTAPVASIGVNTEGPGTIH